MTPPHAGGATDWIHRAPQSARLERIEAFFRGHAYDMHRHDTYAIGQTLSGVQSFHYRQGRQYSQPGRTMVLHPDELHDGQAATEAGFRYRMIYIQPAAIQQVLGGKPLPYIPDGLSSDPALHRATRALLQGLDAGVDPLEEDDGLFDLATALDRASGARKTRRTLDYRAAERAREFIHAELQCSVSLDQLECASGRDRWSLSRDFRLLYGTSPYRYLTMRRLDRVRQLIGQGLSLADAAASAGFADQSHMTRQFTKTYGVAPARWLKMLIPEGVRRA
ncbi:AraC family transcriptional regulator [Pseudomonas sp. CrR25]|nr:AraC family transcriptional regulator [Pseudomonas sp. CrR25]